MFLNINDKGDGAARMGSLLFLSVIRLYRCSVRRLHLTEVA